MCIAYKDGGFSKKNNTKTISLLSVNSKDKKIYFHTKTWMQMFIELLFIIAPSRSNPVSIKCGISTQGRLYNEEKSTSSMNGVKDASHF